MAPATAPARHHFRDQLTAELRESVAPVLADYWRELKGRGVPESLATALACHLQGLIVDDLFPRGLTPPGHDP